MAAILSSKGNYYPSLTIPIHACSGNRERLLSFEAREFSISCYLALAIGSSLDFYSRKAFQPC
jgi:hypothetical protein